MKCLLVLCLLGLVAAAMADTKAYPRGCIYVMGTCYEECPEGTHAYAIGCDNKIPEPTCDEPNPVKEKHMMCDFSACYCDPPTVKDTVSGKCVQKSECPPKKEPEQTEQAEQAEQA